MQVRLSSRKREIIDHGTVFLFDECGDFTLNLESENAYEMMLTLHFMDDPSQSQRIDTDVSENHIQITCINFAAEGTGLTAPMELAVIDGKKIYFMFWAYLEGNRDDKPKARKVEYTLYSE